MVLTDYQAEEENSSASSLKLIQPSRFSWVLKSVYAERDFALPACIGSEGINVLLRRIQNRLIDFGYVTTRGGGAAGFAFRHARTHRDSR